MRLHRFFIQEKIQDKKQFILEDALVVHQFKNVLRLKEECQIILADNSGMEYVCVIVSQEKNKIILDILESRKAINISEIDLHLFQSLIKKDKFEWVLEKGTELGVNNFTPVLSERSEKKNLNLDRGRKILKEASEQSGRGFLPKLFDVATLQNIIRKKEIPIIVFDPSGEKIKKEKIKFEKIGILIWPE